MKTRRCWLVLGAALVCAALPVALFAQQPTPTPKPKLLQAERAMVSMLPCAVSGQIKLDPADHTNGYSHYKGGITFKANVALEGVNLYLSGQGIACTCVTCPTGSSHATGLKPEGKFSAGQFKTYNADCGTFPPNNTLSGPLGKGKIQYFVMTSPPGGVFKDSNCGGSFTFGY